MERMLCRGFGCTRAKECHRVGYRNCAGKQCCNASVVCNGIAGMVGKNFAAQRNIGSHLVGELSTKGLGSNAAMWTEPLIKWEMGCGGKGK